MITTQGTYRGREKYDQATATAYQRVPPFKHRAEMKLIDRAFTSVPRHFKVLDVPCGGGRVSVHLARQGYSMEAADLSDAMVKIALKNVAETGVNCSVIKQDVEEMTYPNGSFDAVVCFRLFHHFPNGTTRRRCVAELCRVARRTVVLSYFSPWSATSLRRKVVSAFGGKKSPKHSTSLKEVRTYFDAHGFKLVKDFARAPLVHTLHIAVFERSASR